jgi:transcriptional regulator with XRE-family HTH domain
MSTKKLTPETTYQSVIGRILVKFRKALNIDQSVLAASAGVTQSTWSRIERGESPLTVSQLAKASESLRVHPSNILIEAEQAISELKKQGVIIRMDNVETKKNNNAIAMIGAAALGALVGAAISKGGDENT